MHVLVHERVLHDDDEFQLADADWVVQVPDVRWRSDSDTNTYADSNTDSNSNTDTDSNPDASAGAKRAHEFGCECRIHNADQLVVD